MLAAHREQDALKYTENLKSLEPLDVMRLAAEFSQPLERLVKEVTKLVLLTANPSVILKDMLILPR
jgi:hypothetical protein